MLAGWKTVRGMLADDKCDLHADLYLIFLLRNNKNVNVNFFRALQTILKFFSNGLCNARTLATVLS